MSFIFKCNQCGHNNTEEDIEYTFMTCGASCGCEGYESELICSACGNEMYRRSNWGQFDREEVAEEIQDELFPSTQEEEKELDNKNKIILPVGDSITHYGTYGVYPMVRK